MSNFEQASTPETKEVWPKNVLPTLEDMANVEVLEDQNGSFIDTELADFLEVSSDAKQRSKHNIISGSDFYSRLKKKFFRENLYDTDQHAQNLVRMAFENEIKTLFLKDEKKFVAPLLSLGMRLEDLDKIKIKIKPDLNYFRNVKLDPFEVYITFFDSQRNRERDHIFHDFIVPNFSLPKEGPLSKKDTETLDRIVLLSHIGREPGSSYAGTVYHMGPPLLTQDVGNGILQEAYRLHLPVNQYTPKVDYIENTYVGRIVFVKKSDLTKKNDCMFAKLPGNGYDDYKDEQERYKALATLQPIISDLYVYAERINPGFVPRPGSAPKAGLRFVTIQGDELKKFLEEKGIPLNFSDK